MRNSKVKSPLSYHCYIEFIYFYFIKVDIQLKRMKEYNKEFISLFDEHKCFEVEQGMANFKLIKVDI